MSSLNKNTKIFIYITLAVSLFCASLLSVCTLFFYDGDIGYYSAGAILPLIATVIFLVSAVALILLPSFLFEKKGALDVVGGTAKYFALVPALAFIFPLADAFKVLMVDGGIFTVLLLAASLTSMIFFALIAFSNETTTTLTVLCGVGVILWLALSWIRSYNDFFTVMNSPDKRFFHFACVGAALLMLGELRVLCSSAKPRSYFRYISLATLTLACFVIPTLADRLSGISYKNAATLGETVVLAALLIYAVARIFSLLPKKEKTELKNECDREAKENVESCELEASEATEECEVTEETEQIPEDTVTKESAEE